MSWEVSVDYRAVVERVVWTFVESFLGALLVIAVLDLEAVEAAATVAATTTLAVVKNVAKKRLEDLPEVE
jgi:hypothetical protein